MNVLLTFMIRNLFYLSITIPFFNAAILTQFNFNLNFVYLLFVFVCAFYCALNGFNFYKSSGILLYFLIFIFGVQVFRSIIITQEVYPTNLLNLQLASCVLGFCISFFLLDLNISNIISNRFGWISLLVFSLVGIVLSFGSVDLIIQGLETQSRSIYNAGAISMAILCGFIIICFFVADINVFYKLIFILPLFFVFWLLGSRGPVISLLVVVFFILMKMRTGNLKVILFSSLLVITPFMVYQIITMRDTVSESNSERAVIMDSSFKLISSEPLHSYFGRFFSETGLIYPHNFFIEMIIDGGLLYALSLSLVIIYLLIEFLRINSTVKNSYLLPYFVFIYLFSVLQFSLSSIEMQKIFLPLTFAVIGLSYQYKDKAVN